MTERPENSGYTLAEWPGAADDDGAYVQKLMPLPRVGNGRPVIPRAEAVPVRVATRFPRLQDS